LFAEGLYAEAGAIDFGDAYATIMRYVELLKLPVVDVAVSPNRVTYARGHRYVTAQDREPSWPYALPPIERQLGRAGIWDKYVVSAYSYIANASSTAWPRAVDREFDRQTLNDYAAHRGLSNEGIALLRFTLSGDDFDHVSALQTLTAEAFVAKNRNWMRIRGGNDQLPNALAAKLGSRVCYGATVVRVSQDPEKVRVSMSTGAGLQQVEADHVVLTPPFSVVRNFTNANTGLLGLTSGNSMASFLLGYVGNGSAGFYTLPKFDPKAKAYGFFAGDTWKATQKLSVTLGLRWDVFTPSVEADNQTSFFDPTGANPGAGGRPGRLAFAGQSGVRPVTAPTLRRKHTMKRSVRA
jgi:hypothetical protein